MSFVQNTCLNKATLLIESMRRDGIDISEAYLFGSAIRGNVDNESDIDVAIVSKDFDGLPFYDIKKISKHRRKVDLRLEVHPFSFYEVAKDPPHFLLQIKKEGIPIQKG